MTIQSQERLLACGMTAILLFLLGLIATWVELRNPSPQLKSFSLTESFAMASSRTSPTPPSTSEPVIPVLQKPNSKILESIETERRITAPSQRILPTTLQLEQSQAPLSADQREFGEASMSIKARVLSETSSLSLSQHERVQQNLRRGPRTATQVIGRSEPSSLSLTAERPTMPRVLKTEETTEILRWMRLSESDLPPGIKRHIGYQQGNLSATSLLEYEDEIWEIYLMARMPSEELHVVIVRGSATYYVVDPSFKRDGRRFRMGVARRRDGQITGITSEERAASSREAAVHYDIFLAWWDELRLTLQ